jgi:hypothetical protein
MIKRSTVTLLTVWLAAMFLAGCGNGSADEDNQAAESAAGGAQDTGDPADTADSSASSDLAEYANRGSGINLRYPVDWSVLEETGSSVTLASDAAFAEGQTPTEPYGLYMLSVTGTGMVGLSETPSGSDLAEYLSQRFTDFDLPEGSIVVPVAETTLAGQPAASGVVQLDDGTGVEVRNIFTVFVTDDRLVTTLSVVPAVNQESFEPLFAAINESVEIQAADLALVEGVETQSDLDRSHDAEVVYPDDQLPPIGGIHNPFWQNCGIYDEPVVDSQAVHSLEHGAVWITYNPSVPTDEVEHLRDLARGQAYVLLSPYPDLRSPVVLGAWGVRLELDSALDERIPLFIERYQAGPQTPEPGASCQSGVGNPIDG